MTSKIKITFLGTSGAIPSDKKNHPAILLTYEGENILIDCGEGTQRQFRKAKLNPCKINKILITHWHGDHVLGLPGLLQTLSLSGATKKIFIYGPKGTKKFIKKMFETFVFRGKQEIEVKEVEGKFFEAKDFYLEAEKMVHGIPCNAYNFVKKGQIRIDKEKLEKSELPKTVILSKLKLGKDISYQGKKYLAKNLTYSEGGKKISVVLDTKDNSKIGNFVENADLLIIESSFDSDGEKFSKEYFHMTSEQDAKIAKNFNVKKMILTHLSSRHDKNYDKLVKEAKNIFPSTLIAKDLESFEI